MARQTFIARKGPYYALEAEPAGVRHDADRLPGEERGCAGWQLTDSPWPSARGGAGPKSTSDKRGGSRYVAMALLHDSQ